MLEPDRDQIEIFVDALFRYVTSGAVSLRSFRENRSEPFQIVPSALNGVGLTGLIDLAERMAKQAANTPEPVVFCPPLATFRNGRSATESDIVEGPVLSVECDARPEEARAELEAALGPATIVVCSGGQWTDASGARHNKLHLHRRDPDPQANKHLTALNRARQRATRLVGAAESAAPVVHPIRWPGSWPRKGEPRLCTIETANPDREIVLELALDALEAMAPPAEAEAKDFGGERRPGEGGGGLHQVLSGRADHPAFAPGAASMAAWGAPEPVIDNVLRCLLLNSQPTDAERTRRRDVELAKLPQTIHSAFAKFGPKTQSEPPEQPSVHWHGEDTDTDTAREWLIDGLLPRTGLRLINR